MRRVFRVENVEEARRPHAVSGRSRLFVARLGNAFKIEHAQVLKYLYRAKDAGRAAAVLSGPGGITRGWVPATARYREDA